MPDPANRRASYRCFLAIPTRWMDNDTYGHVNNVSFYSYFDTAVNEHLIGAGSGYGAGIATGQDETVRRAGEALQVEDGQRPVVEQE